jgi:hypothetical protein
MAEMRLDGWTEKSGKPFQSRKNQQNAGKQTGGAGTFMEDHKVRPVPKPRLKGPNAGGGRASGDNIAVTWHVTVDGDGVDFGSLQSIAPKTKHQCHATALELKVTGKTAAGKILTVIVMGPPDCFVRVRKWLDEYLWTATGDEYAEQMPLPLGAHSE